MRSPIYPFYLGILVFLGLCLSCQIRDTETLPSTANLELLSGLTESPNMSVEIVPEAELHQFRIILRWYPKLKGRIRLSRISDRIGYHGNEGFTAIGEIDAEGGIFSDSFATPLNLRGPINESRQPESRPELLYRIESLDKSTQPLDGIKARIGAPRDCRMSQGKTFAIPPPEKFWACHRLIVADGASFTAAQDSIRFGVERFEVEKAGTAALNFSTDRAPEAFTFIATQASGHLKINPHLKENPAPAKWIPASLNVTVFNSSGFNVELPERTQPVLSNGYSLNLPDHLILFCKEGTLDLPYGSVFRRKGRENRFLFAGDSVQLTEIENINGKWEIHPPFFWGKHERCENQKRDLRFSHWADGKETDAVTFEAVDLDKIPSPHPFSDLHSLVQKLVRFNSLYNASGVIGSYWLEEGPLAVSTYQFRFLDLITKNISYWLERFKEEKRTDIKFLFDQGNSIEAGENGVLKVPSAIDPSLPQPYHRFLKAD